MLRGQRLWIAVALLSLMSPAALAQSSGVIASFNGSLSSGAQQDRIAFEVDSDHFQFNSHGAVDFVFVMSAVQGADAPVDPGLISIESTDGSAVKIDVRKPDTAGSTASIALATLTSGKYQVSVRNEHKTAGAYQLDVLLAGDVNGDWQVDATDVQLIQQLSGTKIGDDNYSAIADIDRNGMINGGDAQRALANLGALAVPPDPDNPLDHGLPEGSLSLASGSPDTFVSRNGLKFSLVNAEFDTSALSEFVLTLNGKLVAASSLAADPHTLTANVTLVDGRNQVSLKAYDAIGRPLYYSATLWAGTYSMKVNLVNANGTPYTSQASVVAAVSDDQSVTEQAITTTGTVTFTNVPWRTIVIKARGAANEIGTAGAIPSSAAVKITMAGFNAPDTTGNNDFTLGSSGWTVSMGTPVSIIPHTEVIAGFAPTDSGSGAATDSDLQFSTTGFGELSVSRTFTAGANTTLVRIRYRFVSRAVSNGQLGGPFNAYYRISIRSQQAGGYAGETNSMNGLGASAFNMTTGQTNWREVALVVDKPGDTIQVDAAVANVGSAYYASQVILDFVQEVTDPVRPQLAWNNTTGGLDLSWQVNSALLTDVTIGVYFSTGTNFGTRLGTPLFTFTVPTGTQPGAGGPVHVAGSSLSTDPAGTKYVLAASSPAQIASLPDVVIGYGPNADPSAMFAAMVDTVRDGMRAAGLSHGTVANTERTPADQARAMFVNSLNSGAQSQLDLYLAPGQAVIQVYINMTATMTAAQISTNASQIRTAMLAELINQGPTNVSHHCSDPAVRNIAGFSQDSFNSGNLGLFAAAVQPRVSAFASERATHSYRLELQ